MIPTSLQLVDKHLVLTVGREERGPRRRMGRQGGGDWDRFHWSVIFHRAFELVIVITVQDADLYRYNIPQRFYFHYLRMK